MHALANAWIFVLVGILIGYVLRYLVERYCAPPPPPPPPVDERATGATITLGPGVDKLPPPLPPAPAPSPARRLTAAERRRMERQRPR